MSPSTSIPAKRKAAGGDRAADRNNHRNDTASDANAQRQRLLAALRRGQVTTLDARRILDILHPAARVQELRNRGHHIITHWREEPTDCGELHRVALYVLLAEVQS